MRAETTPAVHAPQSKQANLHAAWASISTDGGTGRVSHAPSGGYLLAVGQRDFACSCIDAISMRVSHSFVSGSLATGCTWTRLAIAEQRPVCSSVGRAAGGVEPRMDELGGRPAP